MDRPTLTAEERALIPDALEHVEWPAFHKRVPFEVVRAHCVMLGKMLAHERRTNAAVKRIVDKILGTEVTTEEGTDAS